MRVLMLEYHLRRRWEHNERSQQHMERYRSGHNEAVLKTVWGQPHKGSNPFLSAIYIYTFKDTTTVVSLKL